MIPTTFGFIVAAIGLLLLVGGSVSAMYSFIIACSILGASAAFQLPALGGSSIQPVHFALGFFILRLLLPGSGAGHLVAAGFRANGLLIAYAINGVTLAYVAPRIFANQIMVVPLRPTASHYLFSVIRLQASNQNLTASVYMIGTAMLAVASYAACRRVGSEKVLISTGAVMACVHIFFGVTSVAFAGTAWTDVLDLFRNGSYAMLDQRIGTVVRMTGIHPEPSSFAGYGIVWFLFMSECWYRDVRPRTTGPIALAMGVTLAASTSSTAYLALGAYLTILPFRAALMPDGVNSGKLIRLGIIGLTFIVLLSLAFLLRPQLVATAHEILVAMTIDKQGSDSSIQRAFGAKQAVIGFTASSGLGIGLGSFRSSSFITAVIGATGLLGTALFSIYILHILKPWRASTYNRVRDARDAAGVAAAWTACCMLIPACFAAPTADPGNDFAIFAGAALALRGASHGMSRHQRLSWRSTAVPAEAR